MTPKKKTINIVLMNGGVGDHCASFVAIDYIYRKYPWITMLCWMPDLLVEFAKNLIDPSIQVMGYSQMKGRYQPERTTKTTQWDGVTSPMKIHSLDYAFLKLCDEIVPLKEKNYLRIRDGDVSKFSLPKDFVVITTGFTAEVREFRPEIVNKAVDYSQSLGLDVVFLGQKEAKTGALYSIKATFNGDIDFKAGIDLRDSTSLSEAAWIMSRARAVLGVDNGLLHVAGCTDVPIVGGFTTVRPAIRMPVRNNTLGWKYHPVTPNNDLECRYCQQETNFLYGHNYTKCLFEVEPAKLLCTKQMTAEKFIRGLEQFL